MYKMSVNKTLRINSKGEAKMESLDVQVNGYRNQEALSQAVTNYNNYQSMPEPKEPKNWAEERWNYLFEGMVKRRKFKHDPNMRKKKRF